MKFVSKIWQGNSKGVGFATIPKKLLGRFSLNETVEISGDTFSQYFAKIRSCKRRLGMYLPQGLCTGKKEMQLIINKIEGFRSKIGSDGRIYIPKHLMEKLKIKSKDVVLVEANIGEKIRTKHCRAEVRIRNGKKECKITFDSNSAEQYGTFKIHKKLSKEITCTPQLKNVLMDFDSAQVDKNKIIIYFDKMWPVVINTDINIANLAYYLGCFFADGTKKGFNWAITASTFEQARFYLSMHKLLIPESKAKSILTFSTKDVNDIVKEHLAEKWNQEISLNVDPTKVRLVKTNADSAPNRNKFGALTIRECRQLILKYYAQLTKVLLEQIKLDPQLGFDFICGVLEGDGCANAKSRGHVSIASNELEKQTIVDVLEIIGVRYKQYKEDRNKYTIRIGALEILKNLPTLKDKLFRYYPKRRKRFIERFCNVGATRFILRKQKHVAGWVKAWMVKENILDKNYILTPYGEEIKENLTEMNSEIK